MTKIAPIWSVGSLWGRALDGYEWGMTLGQNLLTSQFMVRGQNCKNCFFLLTQSIENLKLYNTSKNQSPRLLKKVDMRGSPWKRAISRPSPHRTDLESWNLLCTFRKDPRCDLRWYRLFSLMELFPWPKNKVFWSVFIFSPEDKIDLLCPIPAEIAPIWSIGSGELDIYEWGDDLG